MAVDPESSARSDVSQLLLEWSEGDAEAFDELLPLVTDELRRLAAVEMSSESVGHTLQPTALVNELFLRLTGRESVSWTSRSHFFGTAVRMMRRILIDHARKKKAQKRGGDAIEIPLEPEMAAARSMSVDDLLALDEALERLERMDEGQVRLVELKFFGGLTIDEMAEVLGMSPATVSRQWASARAWLYGELADVPVERP